MKTIISATDFRINAIVDELFIAHRDKLTVLEEDVGSVSLLEAVYIDSYSVSLSLPDGVLTEKELDTIIEKHRISLEKPSLPEPTLPPYEMALKRFLGLGFSEEEIALFLPKEAVVTPEK